MTTRRLVVLLVLTQLSVGTFVADLVMGGGGSSLAIGRPHRSLLALAQHYGFLPKACRPYRAKTKGKVERPFRYIREDFFLARSFSNPEDLNRQLQPWLSTVANPRVHPSFAPRSPSASHDPATTREAA